jgi:hypothetical protein
MSLDIGDLFVLALSDDGLTVDAKFLGELENFETQAKLPINPNVVNQPKSNACSRSCELPSPPGAADS